jgi:hypothetical protein
MKHVFYSMVISATLSQDCVEWIGKDISVLNGLNDITPAARTELGQKDWSPKGLDSVRLRPLPLPLPLSHAHSPSADVYDVFVGTRVALSRRARRRARRREVRKEAHAHRAAGPAAACAAICRRRTGPTGWGPRQRRRQPGRG